MTTLKSVIEPYLFFEGRCEEPLSKTLWSPRFGMVTDIFGIMWMISVLTGQRE
jgi:uncharacterized glyoxalase superfamily protein PhnB